MRPNLFLAALIVAVLLGVAPASLANDETTSPNQPTSPLAPLAAGDRVRITIDNLFLVGGTAAFDRTIDRNGEVDVPYVGQVKVGDLSERLARREVVSACLRTHAAGARPSVTLTRLRSDPGSEERLIAHGDWLRIRMWTGPARREKQYVLRVAADSNIRFPNVGLLHVENMRESVAEKDVFKEVKKRNPSLADELMLETISDAEADATRDAVRVGQLPAGSPMPEKPGDPSPDLSGDPSVKLIALPWRGDAPIASFQKLWTPVSTQYHATGRLEEILNRSSPFGRDRVVWNTILPDGFFEFEASAASLQDLFQKLSGAYHHAFGCSIVEARRDMPCLVLSANAEVAEKKLKVHTGIVHLSEHGPKDAHTEFFRSDGTMANLAEQLEAFLGTPVLDETALTQPYEVEFLFETGDDRVALMNRSMQMLGLSLAKASRNIDCIVVSEAARTAAPPRSQARPAPEANFALTDVTITEIKGSVQVRKSDDEPWSKGSVATVFPWNAKIRVGPHSHLKFTTSDGRAVLADRLGTFEFGKLMIDDDELRKERQAPRPLFRISSNSEFSNSKPFIPEKNRVLHSCSGPSDPNWWTSTPSWFVGPWSSPAPER